MPYDPETFENLYPFPNKGLIREAICEKLKYGELKVPEDRILDSKSWIEERLKEEYQRERNLWDKSEGEAIEAWQLHMEEEHDFAKLPEALRRKIHSQVWEDGHSGGYGEMNNRYIDLVPLVVEAFEFGRQSVSKTKKYMCPA